MGNREDTRSQGRGSPQVSPEEASGRAASAKGSPPEALEQLRWQLQRQSRELACIYSLAEATQSDRPLPEIFEDVAALVPTGWKYPEITRARIVFDDQQHVAEPFEPTEWKLSSDIIVAGSTRGQLEVYYLQQLPEIDEGPFSNEQRVFMDALAGMVAQAAEKKLTDEALSFQSAIIEQTIEGVVTLDRQGNIILTNRSMAAMHGYEPKELIGKHLSIFHTPKQVPSVEAAIGRVVETGQFTGEIWHVRRDGSIFPAMMRMTVLRDDAGEQIGTIGTCLDISERKQAKDAADFERRQLLAIFDTIDQVVYVSDLKTHKILYANKALVQRYGDALGRKCHQVLRGRTSPCACCNNDRLQKEPDKPCICWECRNDRYGRFYHCIFKAIRWPDGRTVRCGMAIDISQRKRAEQEFRAERRHLRALTSELSMAEHRERQRISAALHDDVSQELAAAKIKIGLLGRSVSSGRHAKAIEEIFQTVDRALQDVTSLTFQLCPPVLYREGLDAALKWLVEQFDRRHDASFEFVSDGRSQPMSDEARGFVFQVTRELLINVVRHARANHVTVTTRNRNGEMTITVADDGVGFDPTAVARRDDETGGFGLFSIRQRVGYFGGRLDITPQPGQGSHVTVTIPLAGEDEP